MLLTIKELKTWLGLSIFEIWLHIVSLLVFSILLAVKTEQPDAMSWWTVFIPLFICDGCVAYFSSIVFIRLIMVGEKKIAALRTLWSSCSIALLVAFKVFLCQKLEGSKLFGYAVIHIPLFVLLKLLALRACQADSWDLGQWTCSGLVFLEIPSRKHRKVREGRRHDIVFRVVPWKLENRLQV